MDAFGPVPSRRLGQSLGINNVPSKICSYGCVYCQVGRTNVMQVRRELFTEPEEVYEVVRDRVEKTRSTGGRIDYLSFVPDGEATLDVNLGREIDLLKSLRIPIAVITNSSLIDDPDVQLDLMKADLVSLKVDAVRERAWRQVDRPHGRLNLNSILEGMIVFARKYRGRLLSETLLVHGANDSQAEVTATADFIAELKPHTAYLSIPTRPPSEDWVRPPTEAAMNRAYHIFASRLERVECLIAAETGTFGFTGNVEVDILATAAVHPMREEAVRELLARADADWSVVEKLVESKALVELVYRGDTFYFRKLPRARRESGERANQ